MSRRAATLMLAFVAGLTLAQGRAAAAPQPPIGLLVLGGAETWHVENRFSLYWDNPSDAAPPVAAVHYRVKAPGGTRPLPKGGSKGR